MRRKIVAANWKMNTTVAQGIELLNQVVKQQHKVANDVELIVGVPFTHIDSICKAAHGSKLAVAAQNCANKDRGAYTGEVSAEMIAPLGATYVILGHSERRQFYGETDETLVEKLALVYANGMAPIFCIGETLDQREAGEAEKICCEQLQRGLSKLTAEQFSKLIIAYEPVWAIGTGKTATAEQAQEIHHYIRTVLSEKFGDAAQNTPIVYGGSCKPNNAKEIFGKADVDGGLIGGAALVADDFIAIAQGF